MAIPSHAERIELGGETAWMWSTKYGWCVLQVPYMVYLANLERDGQPYYTVDWLDSCPRKGAFAGGVAHYEPGHLDRESFLPLAGTIIDRLRQMDAPPSAEQIRGGMRRRMSPGSETLPGRSGETPEPR